MAAQLSPDVIAKLQQVLDTEVSRQITEREAKVKQMLASQLRSRGIVVNKNETRDTFSAEVWTLLDELDRSRGEQMRLKTELSTVKEELKNAPVVKLLAPRIPLRQGILKDPKPKSKPKGKPKPLKRFVLYECGICDHLHPWTFKGDCRSDGERYAGIEDYCRRTSVDARDVDVKTWDDRQADDVPF